MRAKIDKQLVKACTVLMLMLMTFSYMSAQQSSVPCLERNISLNADNKNIVDVLHLIEKEIGCNFSFNSALIPEGKKVTVHQTNKTVRQALDKVFTGTLQYKERGGYIILTKAEQNKVISGYVENERGEKIANASVYDINTLSSATTNEYGYYEMKIKRDDLPLQLSVSKNNFNDTIIPLQPSTATLQNIVIHETKDSTFHKLVKTVGDSLRSKWSVVSDWTVEQFTSNPNVSNINDTLFTPYQFSVVPFVGTNGKLSGNIESNWSFNVFGGYTGGVRKGEIGLLLNINKNDVKHGQFGGVMNIVGGDMKGFQFAGVNNLDFKSFNGFQIAGLMNLVNDESYGTSIAGLMNIQGGKGAGLSLAGLMNIHGTRHDGAQIAGFMNISEGEINGSQVAGFMNVAEGKVKGMQIAGFMNAADTVKGIQLSGFINAADKVKGVQLGFINLSDTLIGAPIGFFSYVKSGYHKLELAYDEINYAHISFRTGSQYFYNIFDAGTRPKHLSLNNSVWTFGYGIGTAPKLTRKLALNFDVTGSHVYYKKIGNELNLLGKAYLGVDFNFIEKCSITAGVTFNTYFTEDEPNLLTSLEYWPAGMRETQLSDGYQMNSWFGWRVGIRFF